MRIACALLLAAILGGCGGSESRAEAPPQRLAISGSSTAAPLVSQIARRYESLHPGLRIDVQTGGSSRGIADVAAGLADIGLLSRSLQPAERAGRRSYVLARDGVAFVVHRDNPVRELTEGQLKAVYTGQIRDWGEVGGRAGPITVISRAEGRSELTLVSERWGISPAELRPDAIAGDNAQGIKQVAGDPGAIIYISVGTAEYEAARGAPIRLLPLGGVAASSATVASGDYPLVRPLILVTAADPAPPVRAFVEFALSDDVRDLVREQAFVSAGP